MSKKWVVVAILSVFLLSLGTVFAQQTIIEQVKWNSDGSRLFLAYSNENIRVINSANLQLIFQGSLSGNYKTAEWHPSNPLLFALAENNAITRTGTISVMDSSTGRIQNLTTVGETVTDIAWSPDGQRIAIALGFINQGFTRQIRIWNISTNQIELTIAYTQHDIIALAWSPDGSRLASSGADYRIVIWDARTGQQLDAISNPALMQNLAWSPEGGRIVASSSSNPSGIWIWDAQTRQVIRTLSNSFVSDLEWNVDTVRLAVSNSSNRINIWDSVAGRILSTIGSSSPVYDVAWNPAGTSLAIASNNDLPIIVHFPSANAGIDQTLADTDNDGREIVSLSGSASFDPDGTIINYQWIENGIQIASGLNPQVSLSIGEHRIILMTSDSQGAVDLDELLITVVGMTTNSPNRVIYSSGGTLYMTDSQFTSPQALRSGYDVAWSPDGSKIAFSARAGGNDEIHVMNADGSNLLRLTNDSASDRYPSWSPDGTKLVYASHPNGGDWEIYTMNADGTNKRFLTNNTVDDLYPAWSPDGRKIAFSRKTSDDFDIFTMNANGSGSQRLLNRDSDDFDPAWSPDGTRLLFTAVDGNSNIFVINIDGTGLRALTTNRADDEQADWSPDGSQIIFRSTRSGSGDLYIMNANGSNQVQLSYTPSGEEAPSWGYP
jgi:Tol biopolymer transport system component